MVEPHKDASQRVALCVCGMLAISEAESEEANGLRRRLPVLVGAAPDDPTSADQPKTAESDDPN